MPSELPGGSQTRLWTHPPKAPRATKETRHNTLYSLLAGTGQPAPAPLLPGHDQARFNILYRPGNLTGAAIATQLVVRNRPARNQNHNQNQNLPPGAPSLMENGTQACFGGSAFLFLVPGCRVRLILGIFETPSYSTLHCATLRCA